MLNDSVADASRPDDANDARSLGAEKLDALGAALVEIERHVSKLGWDQPARLFALVPTAELLTAEPTLRGQLHETMPGAFSSIEQDEYRSGDDLLSDLAAISWPPSVHGAALATERAFLTADHEAEIPDDPAAAADFVAHHPDRQDIRLVAGALRSGETFAVARLRTNPDELLSGPELVPALVKALHLTFAQWDDVT